MGNRYNREGIQPHVLQPGEIPFRNRYHVNSPAAPEPRRNPPRIRNPPS